MKMKAEYLFDTGCLLDIYHGRARIEPYFQAIAAHEITPYTSVITEAELWRGLRPGEIARHEALLAQFIVLPLHSEAARLAGSWLQTYDKTGLGWMDAFIAAAAKAADIPLLTRDKRLANALAAELIIELYL